MRHIIRDLGFPHQGKVIGPSPSTQSCEIDIEAAAQATDIILLCPPNEIVYDWPDRD